MPLVAGRSMRLAPDAGASEACTRRGFSRVPDLVGMVDRRGQSKDPKRDPQSPEEKPQNSADENRREQADVLERKDHVLRSGRGLQQWGDTGTSGEDRNEGLHGDPSGAYGEASMGTAERQAGIGGLAPGHKPGDGQISKESQEHPPGREAREREEREREQREHAGKRETGDDERS